MHKWVNLEVDHKTYSQSRTSSSSVCTGLTLQPDRRTWWGVTQEVTHGQRLKGQIQKFKSDKYNILQTVYAWHVISRLISTWRYQDSEKLCSYSKYRCPSYLGASSTGLSLTSIQTSVTLKHRGKVMMEEAYDHLLKYPTHKHKTEEIRNKIRGQGHPELPVGQRGSLALVWFIWREPSGTWKPQSDFTDETFSRKTGTKNLKQQPLRLLLFLVSSSEKKTREESGSIILSSGAPSHLSPHFTQCRWSSVFFYWLQAGGVQVRSSRGITINTHSVSLHSWKSGGSGESTSTLRVKTKKIWFRWSPYLQLRYLFVSFCVSFSLLRKVLSHLGAGDTSVSGLAGSAVVTLR